MNDVIARLREALRPFTPWARVDIGVGDRTVLSVKVKDLHAVLNAAESGAQTRQDAEVAKLREELASVRQGSVANWKLYSATRDELRMERESTDRAVFAAKAERDETKARLAEAEGLLGSVAYGAACSEIEGGDDGCDGCLARRFLAPSSPTEAARKPMRGRCAHRMCHGEGAIPCNEYLRNKAANVYVDVTRNRWEPDGPPAPGEQAGVVEGVGAVSDAPTPDATGDDKPPAGYAKCARFATCGWWYRVYPGGANECNHCWSDGSDEDLLECETDCEVGPDWRPPATPRSLEIVDAYPCHECGTARTKAEGGSVFTVCDECWFKGLRGPTAGRTREELAELDERIDIVEQILGEHRRETDARLAKLEAVGPKVAAVEPVRILLHCPLCRAKHIDVGEFATKVHHTHACQGCGHVWRPAVEATVGVEFLPGFKNEAPPDAGAKTEGT